MTDELYDVLCPSCLRIIDSAGCSVEAHVIAADGQYNRGNYSTAELTYQKTLSIMGYYRCTSCQNAIERRIRDCGSRY